MLVKLPPLLLTLIFAALMWALSWLLPQFTFEYSLKNILAISVALGGALICSLGVISFWRVQTTMNPMQPNHASSLVVSGIYRITRNPMYLGFFLLLIAWAIYLAHILVLLLIPPFFVTYMNRFQILPEERALEFIFGNDYRIYKSHVRRWL